MTATLPTCPREDCTATGDHWHATTLGETVQCYLPDHQCVEHDDPESPRRCYAPRTPQPKPAAVVLPTVDEAARVIPEAWANPSSVGSVHLIAAQAVLDLVAARLPAWQPVEPGTVIKAGTRVRNEWTTGGEASEWDLSTDITFGDPPDVRRMWLDPRTVPAEPEDPRVAVVLDWYLSSEAPGTDADLARDLLTRLDAVRADA